MPLPVEWKHGCVAVDDVVADDQWNTEARLFARYCLIPLDRSRVVDGQE
jgi:hypothetical protein